MSERHPESFLPLKPDLFQVLLALIKEDRHGYGIVKEVERNTGGQVRLAPSPLYRKLKRLIDEGVLEESDQRPTPESDDERRRYYRLTPLGRKIAQAEARRLVALVEDSRVQGLAKEAMEAGHA